MESDIDAVFVSFPSSSETDRKARESFFIGDIAEWARHRQRQIGDLIVPKHMYIEWVYGERHNAAWLEHSGRDQDTGEPYHMHHIACDCIRHESPEIIEDDLTSLTCPVLYNALTERARLVDRKFRIHEMLSELDGLGVDEYHDMVLGVMENTLVRDQMHPDQWFGNAISGQHRSSLMSEILHIPVETVQMYADILELKGKIERDGDIIRLAA